MKELMTKNQFMTLIKRGHPIDDSDWGSEEQINAENAVYNYLEKILTAPELEKYELWASKATVDERMDEALRLYLAIQAEV